MMTSGCIPTAALQPRAHAYTIQHTARTRTHTASVCTTTADSDTDCWSCWLWSTACARSHTARTVTGVLLVCCWLLAAMRMSSLLCANTALCTAVALLCTAQVACTSVCNASRCCTQRGTTHASCSRRHGGVGPPISVSIAQAQTDTRWSQSRQSACNGGWHSKWLTHRYNIDLWSPVKNAPFSSW